MLCSERSLSWRAYISRGDQLNHSWASVGWQGTLTLDSLAWASKKLSYYVKSCLTHCSLTSRPHLPFTVASRALASLPGQLLCCWKPGSTASQGPGCCPLIHSFFHSYTFPQVVIKCLIHVGHCSKQTPKQTKVLVFKRLLFEGVFLLALVPCFLFPWLLIEVSASVAGVLCFF